MRETECYYPWPPPDGAGGWLKPSFYYPGGWLKPHGYWPTGGGKSKIGGDK